MNYYAYLLGRGARGARIPAAQAKAFMDFWPKMPDLDVLVKAAKERGHKRISVKMIQWNVFADLVKAGS